MMFTCEYITTFRASTEHSCMSSVFLIKFRAVYFRAAALLRRWSTVDFFLKFFSQTFFIFFKQLVFGIFSKRICGEFPLRQSCSLKTVGL